MPAPAVKVSAIITGHSLEIPIKDIHSICNAGDKTFCYVYMKGGPIFKVSELEDRILEQMNALQSWPEKYKGKP